jgi:hypothetical protein
MIGKIELKREIENAGVDSNVKTAPLEAKGAAPALGAWNME